MTWVDSTVCLPDCVIPIRTGTEAGGDPQEQFASPFSYAGNNPVMMTDPDGEILPLIAVVAIVGGVINLGTNIAQGNLSGYGFWETIGRGAVSFGAGAASGALSLSGPMGWAAGGAIVGGANAGLGGGDIINGLVMGAATGLAGGAFGRALGPGLGRLADGLADSPALNGAISGALGGGLVGFGLGGISSLASGGDFWDGAWQGGAMGLLTGAIGGGAAAAKQAHDLGFNPWTGARMNSIAVQQLTPKGANTSTSPPVQKPISGTGRVGVKDGGLVSGYKSIKVRNSDFAGKNVTYGNTVPRNKSVLGHIFINKIGHVNPPTSSQSRYIKLFESVSNNPSNLDSSVLSNYQRVTGGFEGYSQTFSNNRQVWVHVRNGRIFDAGVNLIGE